MQTFNSHLFQSPSYFQNSAFFRIIRLFKFELIKVLIFLLLFIATVFIVNTESKQYYEGSSHEMMKK